MKIILRLIILTFVVGCTATKKRSISAEDKVKAFNETKFVYVAESMTKEFVQDDKPETLQILTVQSGKSTVSKDGQVIYLNKADTAIFKELLDKAIKIKALMSVNKI